MLLQHDHIPFLFRDAFHRLAVFGVLAERVPTGRVLAGHDVPSAARLGKARQNAGQVVHERVAIADEKDTKRPFVGKSLLADQQPGKQQE